MRRLPALAARLRGRAARARGRGRDRVLPRGDELRRCKGPYDLSLVEGSVTTAHDAKRIKQVRRLSRKLVTIGACATAGGIQALKNFADVDDFISAVYASPQFISTLDTSTPISAHVPVDFELNGCPINKHQLLEVITAFLHGRRPNIPLEQRLHGVQAPRHRLRDRRARHAVPRPGHPRGLRRDSARLQPRLLRLLRADGDARTPSRSPGSSRCSGWGTRAVERVFRTFNVQAFEEARAHDD